MRRIATVLATVVVICLLRLPDVLAAGGSFGPPPGKTVGPAVNVVVVMEGPRQPSVPTSRQFAVTVHKGGYSQAALFTGGVSYLYGCLQPGFPDLQASTEQRFLGFMNSWAPTEVLDALIRAVGDPDRAAIIDIDNISCTPVGDHEYLSFTGRIKFAK
jgi:hypothetical protein